MEYDTVCRKYDAGELKEGVAMTIVKTLAGI
jgi:hypothetical protein